MRKQGGGGGSDYGLLLCSQPPYYPPSLSSSLLPFPEKQNRVGLESEVEQEEEQEEEEDAATRLLVSDPSKRLRELGVGGLDVAFQDIFRR